MLPEELVALIYNTQKLQTETQTLEAKAAAVDCPKKLYDTLSSFSNQDDGGIILFGVDEKNHFQAVGVYDVNDLQKKVAEQCQQMEPIIRPVFTIAEMNGHHFLSVEIPGLDISQRPCYYKGQGRLKGAFTRSGDGDYPMTEYEIYSYEAYRKRYHDDIRPIPGSTLSDLNIPALETYLWRLKQDKDNLSSLTDQQIYHLMGILKNNTPTMLALLLFGTYPQAIFPQLCIHAVVTPDITLGRSTKEGLRFIDNKKIEGTIPQMLDKAMQFIQSNIRTATILDPTTGMRNDRTEYSILAIREIILNALIHRDYSRYTEGMPIEITLYPNRLEVKNPGGLYGRLTVSQLGKTIPDTRNPHLVNALELLQVTENRHSGIPTIQEEMKKYHLPPATFTDNRNTFQVIIQNTHPQYPKTTSKQRTPLSSKDLRLLDFCADWKTKKEIASFLGIKSVSYAKKQYIQPLVDQGLLRPSNPDSPGSHGQKYMTAENSDK